MIKLKTIYKEFRNNLSLGGEELHPSNLEEVFFYLIKLGIKEVIVNENEMITIIRYIAVTSGNTEIGIRAILDGKTDRFLGIKLVLK